MKRRLGFANLTENPGKLGKKRRGKYPTKDYA
jgi:hypothetical protein